MATASQESFHIQSPNRSPIIIFVRQICLPRVLKVSTAGVVIVAQLAERLLPTPEIRGSNSDIGNELFRMYLCQLLSRKDENKEKETRNGPN